MALERTPRLDYVEITSTTIKIYLLETQEGYDNFNWQVYNNLGNLFSGTTNNTNQNPIVINNLEPNSQYGITLTSIFSGVSGNLDLPYLKTAPNAPTLQTPIINGSNVDLTWTLDNSNEVSYEIFVNNEKVNQTELTITNYQLILLNQPMEIKVRAINKYLTNNYSIGNGQVIPNDDYLVNYSEFSTIFTNNGTQNISETIEYILQSNSIIVQLPNLINNYNLTLLKDQQIINSIMNFSSNSYIFENLEFNTTYQLSVIENSPNPLPFFTNSSTNHNTIQILTLPNSPTNFNKTYTQTILEFSWDFQPNTSYKLKKSTDNQFIDIGSQLNYTWTSPLEDNTEVSFELIAYNLSGNSNPTSISFLTLPNSPISYSIETIDNTTKKITWVPPTNNVGLTYNILDYNFNIIDTIQNTEYTFENLSPSIYYTYYVNSQNQIGSSNTPLNIGFGVEFDSITDFQSSISNTTNSNLDLTLSWELFDSSVKDLLLFYEININGVTYNNQKNTTFTTQVAIDTYYNLIIRAIFPNIVIVLPNQFSKSFYFPRKPELSDFTFSKLAFNNFSTFSFKLVIPNNNNRYLFSYDNINFLNLDNEIEHTFNNINNNSSINFYVKYITEDNFNSFANNFIFRISEANITQLNLYNDKHTFTYNFPTNNFKYTINSNDFLDLSNSKGELTINNNSNLNILFYSTNNSEIIIKTDKLYSLPKPINTNNIIYNSDTNSLDFSSYDNQYTYNIEWSSNLTSLRWNTSSSGRLPFFQMFYIRIITTFIYQSSTYNSTPSQPFLINLKPRISINNEISGIRLTNTNNETNLSNIENSLRLYNDNVIIGQSIGNSINLSNFSLFTSSNFKKFNFLLQKNINFKNQTLISELSDIVPIVSPISRPIITNVFQNSDNTINVSFNIGNNTNNLYKAEFTIFSDTRRLNSIKRTILFSSNNGIISGNILLPNNQTFYEIEAKTFGILDNIEYSSSTSTNFIIFITTNSAPPKLVLSSFTDNLIRISIEKPLNSINSPIGYELTLNLITDNFQIPNTQNSIIIDISKYNLSINNNFNLEISVWYTNDPNKKNTYNFPFKSTQLDKQEIPTINIIKPTEPIFNSEVKLEPPPGLTIHTTLTEEFSRETGLTLNELTNNQEEVNLSVKVIQDQKNLNLKPEDLLVFKAQPEGAIFSDYIKLSFNVQNNSSSLYKVFKISNNLAIEIPFYTSGTKPDSYFIKPSSTLIEVYTKSFSQFLAPLTAPEPDPEPELTFLPCFTLDTQVLTPTGYKLITDLMENDLVLTDDNRKVPIIKIKQYSTSNPKDFPYIIKKFSINKSYPPSTFTISGGHSIKYNDKWIIPKLFGFKQDFSKKSVQYFHIKLPNYSTDNLIINNGAIVESYGIDYYTKYQRIGSTKFFKRFSSKKSNLTLSK